MTIADKRPRATRRLGARSLAGSPGRSVTSPQVDLTARSCSQHPSVETQLSVGFSDRLIAAAIKPQESPARNARQMAEARA
jgi:hypothetical protein